MNTIIQTLFTSKRNVSKGMLIVALFGTFILGSTFLAGSRIPLVSVAHADTSTSTSVSVSASFSSSVSSTASSTGSSTASCGVATGLFVDSLSDATPHADETITYELGGTYSFTASTTINVTDVVPAGLTFVSASPSVGSGSYSSSTGTWNIGTVNDGGALNLGITATVNASDTAGQVITIAPKVDYVQSTCTQTSAVTPASLSIQSATTTTTSTPSADLSIKKIANVTSTTAGGTVDYAITVKNLSGSVTSTGVVATDTLPSGLTFENATASASTSYASSTGTWTIGNLSPNAIATLQIAALVNASTTGTVTNTAIVSASTTDPTLGNNSSSVSISVAPNTSCSLSASQFYADWKAGTIKVGSVTVNNQSSTASMTVMNGTHCTAPISLASYEMFVAPNGVHWLSTQQLFDVTSTTALPANATTTFTVNIAPCMTQVDGYYGQAPAHLLDSNPYGYPNVPFVLSWAFSNGALCSATSTPSADLAITKTADVTSTFPGDTVNYTIKVTDLGSATSTGVVATDTLPSGLTFENATASASTSYASSTGMWTIGTLSASSTVTLQIAAFVNASTTGTVTNTAIVGESASTTDPILRNNSSSVSIYVQQSTSTPTSTPSATIVATKIICPSVADLPDLSGTGTHITSSTAASFIAAHPECHAASGWQFQWGKSSVSDPNVGGNFIGSAPTSTGWNTFGSTDSNGETSVVIANPTSTPKFWVREDLQSGYVPYSFYPGHSVNSTSSAEMFCSTDVLNYDNYDQVISPTAGGTYYCVAWNVPATSTVPSADLSISKTADVTSTSEGGMINYTIKVTDLGSATSTGVVATDTLPSGLTFENATASASTSYASSTGMWTIGTLSASSTVTLQIAAKVNSGVAGSTGTTIANTAIVGESTSSIDNYPSNNSSTVTVTINPNVCATNCGGGSSDAGLTITKTANVTSTLPGGTIRYTIIATATGPRPSTGVVATDTLPSGLTFVNATTSASTTYDSSTGAWTIGNLSPNATATLQIAALVNASGTAGTTITNQVTIGESPTLVNTNPVKTAQATTTVANATSSTGADIAILKTVDNANPVAGADVNYTILVTNNGPATSTLVDVKDVLPLPLSLVSSTISQGSSTDGGTFDWNVGTLSPNATATLVLDMAVGANQAGNAIANTATVSQLSSIYDPKPGNNSSTVTINVQSAGCTSNCGGGGGGGGGGGNVPSAEIGIVKTVDNADPTSGSTINYTLTVSATGPSTSFGVVADDTLPAGVTFVSATPSEGSYVSSTGVWTIGTINAGQSETLVITATVTAANGTTVTNTGTIHESPTVDDPLSGNNSSSVTIDVGGSNGGGGGGGGQVLGASTSTGQVLGASCGLYLTSYIHPYRQNLNDSAQVKKLQTFLNMNLGLDLPVTGYYGSATIAAVNQFQVKYHIEVLAPWVPLGLQTQFTPTSYVYQTTQRWINLIMCPPLNIQMPTLQVDNGE